MHRRAGVHNHSPFAIPFGLIGTPMQAMVHAAAMATGVIIFDISEIVPGAETTG